jgi:septal ring factor EnvC (AmiA/AmiB activator)
LTNIYHAAQVPDQPFTAEQLLEMVASMPPELGLDVKRRTVQGILQAMGRTTPGVNVDSVVGDATAKLMALTSHLEQQVRQTGDHLTRVAAEIRSLEQQIDAKRRESDQIRNQHTQLEAGCRDEWQRLAQVLDFFNVPRPTGTSATK